MHADIICTVPWSCGFKDGCKQGWHLANYWIQDDGTYTLDKYSDGDHDPIDHDELPTADEECEAWQDYYAYVAREGVDPISQFLLPTQIRRKRQWEAQIRNWIGSDKHGLRVISVRRRGRGPAVPWDSVPTEVYDFLFLGHPGYVYGSRDCKQCLSSLGPEMRTLKELESVATNCKVKMRKVLGHMTATLVFEVDEQPPEWSAERVSAWLKRKAKESRACRGWISQKPQVNP